MPVQLPDCGGDRRPPAGGKNLCGMGLPVDDHRNPWSPLGGCLKVTTARGVPQPVGHHAPSVRHPALQGAEPTTDNSCYFWQQTGTYLMPMRSVHEEAPT